MTPPPPSAATLRLSPPSSSTLAASLPPKPQTTEQNLSATHRRHHYPVLSRREAAVLSLLALVPPLSLPAPASAFSIGISGPKEWLKDQKRKSARFLLAPIDASREILRSAYLSLTSSESEYTSKEVEDIQGKLRSAARDCVVQDRNSLVTFQANTGVEVCTFRLIVKNAASLLEKKDPAKLEAEAMLDDLISSFASLNGLANGTDIQLASNRKKVADALMDTISSLNKFEQGVKDCLEA
ncbi:hypothetical protein Tsubulata_027534 [Turnera subulata]|uniref:Uncharacterized protein n=1 Tax=Turnera subulata TaxID=218843 RepID=A0A9Q0JCY6_9ROSI|nr:hypothetical protein Tsubulata_027534 [Turnera subulata]